jgi:ribosomal protein L21E
MPSRKLPSTAASLALVAALALASACSSSDVAPASPGSADSAALQGTIDGATAALTLSVPGSAAQATSDAAGGFVLLGVSAGSSAITVSDGASSFTLPIQPLLGGETRTLALSFSAAGPAEIQARRGTAFGGTIQSLSPLTVAGRTITVTSATELEKGEAAITQADLKVGDTVEIRGALQADGSVVASEIEVFVAPPPGAVEFVAELTAISGTTLTVGGLAVSTTSTTTYHQDRAAITFADLKPPELVRVRGTLASGAVLASDITVLTPPAHPEIFVGTLTAASSTAETLTVDAIVFHYSTSTKVAGAGDAEAISDLKLGDRLLVQALPQADGSLFARMVVRLGTPMPPPPPPPPATFELVGLVASIAGDGSAFTLGSPSWDERGSLTIAVTPSTTYGGDGSPKSLADFKAGDRVDVKVQKGATGSLTALSVTRLPAAPPPPPIELDGYIGSIAADLGSFTLEGPPGSLMAAFSVSVSSSTSYGGVGSPKSLADFKAGDHVKVVAQGSLSKLAAVSVTRLAPPPPQTVGLRGKIASIATDLSGFALQPGMDPVWPALVLQVSVSSSTTYGGDGSPKTLADFKAGDRVEVTAEASPGKLAAQSVIRMPAD